MFAIEIQQSLKGKSNKVLSKELVDQMLTPFVAPDVGLGIMLQKKGNAVYFSQDPRPDKEYLKTLKNNADSKLKELIIASHQGIET